MQTIEANGAIIRSSGLGTWELRGRTCARIVEQAIKLGYRHIDTAQVYENEREVGEGLRASGVRRDDMFLTTEVCTTNFAPHGALGKKAWFGCACRKSTCCCCTGRTRRCH